MNPTPFALLVILVAILSSGERMPRALLICCLFGATAAVELPALGGAPITPAVLLLPFLVWRALQEEGLNACTRQLAYPQAGFWLLLLIAWGVLSAYFLPRLFVGETMLFGTDRGVMKGVRLMPLQPLSTNLTQSAYAVAGLCAFAALGALLQPQGRMLHFRDGVLLLASFNVAAALLNLAELHLGIPSVLEYVRNAGYAILVGGEIGGLQRISGTFAETSAFAAFTLPLLAFTYSLWRDGVRRRYSASLALLTLVVLLLSTSSTAYASLGAYATLVALGAGWWALSGSHAPRLGAGAVLLWTLAVTACLLFLLRPEIAGRVADFFGTTLMRKLETSSGIERSSWNMQAWTNFLDVYGIGVGLGSARASSFPLVLLSNVGVLGTLLFLAFVARLLLPPPTLLAAEEAAVARAARHAVLAALIAASVSGVVFDLGLAFYAFAAAAAVSFAPREVQSSTEGTHVAA